MSERRDTVRGLGPTKVETRSFTSKEFLNYLLHVPRLDGNVLVIADACIQDPCVITHPAFLEPSRVAFRNCTFKRGIQLDHPGIPPHGDGCVISFERCRTPSVRIRGAYRSCAVISCWIGVLELEKIQLDSLAVGVDPKQRNPECAGHGIDQISIQGVVRTLLDLNVPVQELFLDLQAEQTDLPLELGPLFLQYRSAHTKGISVSSPLLLEYFQRACPGTPIFMGKPGESLRVRRP